MSQKAKRLKIPFDPSRLKVKRSNAELLVRIELQKRGLNKYLYPLNSIIIFHTQPVEIMGEATLTKDMVKAAKDTHVAVTFTNPDLLWKMGPLVKAWPVYLDGPPHRRRGVKNRDDAIDAELQDMGYDPKRYPYTAASKKWIKEICDEMEQKVLACHTAGGS